MIPSLQSTEDRRVRHRYSLSKTSAIACAVTLGLTAAALAAPPATSAVGPDAPSDLTARDVELLREKKAHSTLTPFIQLRPAAWGLKAKRLFGA